MLPAPPVPSPVHRMPAAQGQSHHLARQPAVVGRPPVLAPAHFRRVAPEIKAGDVVMDSDLGPAHPAEEAFGLVGAGAVPGIGLLVVDPGHHVAGVQFSKAAPSSAWITPPRATLRRTKAGAAASPGMTAVAVPPSRWRTTTTHWRLPARFSASRRSRRFS